MQTERPPKNLECVDTCEVAAVLALRPQVRTIVRMPYEVTICRLTTRSLTLGDGSRLKVVTDISDVDSEAMGEIWGIDEDDTDMISILLSRSVRHRTVVVEVKD